MSSNTKFENLEDFDDTGLDNYYVIVYDQATNSFKTVDPDVLLSKSVIDSSLPDDFIEVVNDNIVLGGESF